MRGDCVVRLGGFVVKRLLGDSVFRDSKSAVLETVVAASSYCFLFPLYQCQ